MADKNFVVKNGIVVNTSFVANSTAIYFGNSSVNTTINSSSISIGNTVIADSSGAINSSYQTYADTKAATAYTNATSYADTKAATAYSNATSFASNATNITSGTLANARLPSAISVTSLSGNGSGLTSVSYIATSTNASDLTIFSGGDSGAWTRASGSPIFYPTIPANISTLTIGVQIDLFIKQVADDVGASSEIVAGAGNPQFRYRIVKGPSNTALFTSEYNVLSTPGAGGGYIVTAVDASPTTGNTVGYEIQYWWRSGASDPNVNVGTITVSATNTPTVTGTGTYFTGTLNPRLQIARSANPTNWKSISYITGNQSLTVEANWGTAFTANTYLVQDPFANVVMDQTNLVLTFIGYK